MAALTDPASHAKRSELIDLRRLCSSDLAPLLDEETRSWQETLDWDFGKSAALVRRFVDLRALNGCALLSAGQVVGYSYFVFEDYKGLIGDLYLLRRYRSVAEEDRLLDAVLNSIMGSPQITRIESQLMMLAYPRNRPMPYPHYLSSYERNYMVLEMERMPALCPGRLRRPVHFERWSEQHQEAAAQVIASAYAGHVDSRINDQYRSVAGARRFLFNIVQYPGCGTFFKPASYVAVEVETGKVCGLSLASLVAAHSGHITQICVTPWVHGMGVGYELLRQSLKALAAYGCRRTSLTVTAANHEAVRLYDNVGFVTARRFSALVWEGF
jgi:ribosomal protein S18 acetylase RimI-like enzyme